MYKLYFNFIPSSLLLYILVQCSEHLYIDFFSTYFFLNTRFILNTEIVLNV